MTSKKFVDYLEKIVLSIFSVPEDVMKDNGSQFKSDIFNNFLKRYGIHHTYTSEWVKRSIIAGIRSYLGNEQTCWYEQLHLIASALRSSYHHPNS